VPGNEIANIMVVDDYVALYIATFFKEGLSPARGGLSGPGGGLEGLEPCSRRLDRSWRRGLTLLCHFAVENLATRVPGR